MCGRPVRKADGLDTLTRWPAAWGKVEVGGFRIPPGVGVDVDKVAVLDEAVGDDAGGVRPPAAFSATSVG
jgi:hypothetical protein